MLTKIRLVITVVALVALTLDGRAEASPPVTETAASASETSVQTPPVELPAHFTAGDVDGILSQLSDEQVRRLLIAELKKDATKAAADQGVITGSFGQVESSTDLLHRRVKAFFSHIPKVPEDLNGAVYLLTDGEGMRKVGRIGAYFIAILIAAAICEAMFRRLTTGFRKRLASVPPMAGGLKFVSTLLRAIPEWLGIIAFMVTCVAFFLMLHGQKDETAKLVFVAGMAIILMVRGMASISQMICSPTIAKLRLLPLDDPTARRLHRSMVALGSMIAVGLVGTAALDRIGVAPDTVLFVALSIGTLLILTIVGMVWRNRFNVARAIMGSDQDPETGAGWVKSQFADIWHVLATGYLFVIWLLWTTKLITATVHTRGVFFISLLIVPIYLLLDRVGLWVITATVGTLRPSGTDSAEEGGNGRPAEERYVVIVRRAVRVAIVGALGLWMAGLWGIRIPYGQELTNAVFDILVTLGLAHLAWRFISGLIERKLAESTPETEEEEDAGEWGAVAPTDRSQTLLPLLKKFIGVTLMVMVTLMVLSSIGVEIGPLLAGAGVIGLAIGFGAQKLVADVLSGIFFLLDDAFRVGEYIEAGSVSGAVEQITLRNLKLRHHRGMLQLVPFSELGSVTNFMRGGIVVKFSLQLPYDTDIEKVRKVIKKVGQEMLEDEEYGPNFIKPVKSQGVKEVGDSVMTFRAKFTAKPGKHFVIRREAFRRITEALAKKGIYYAHRKVIVDMPEALKSVMGEKDRSENPGEDTTLEQQSALKMGAAAAIDTVVRREGENGSSKKA